MTPTLATSYSFGFMIMVYGIILLFGAIPATYITLMRAMLLKRECFRQNAWLWLLATWISCTVFNYMCVFDENTWGHAPEFLYAILILASVIVITVNQVRIVRDPKLGTPMAWIVGGMIPSLVLSPSLTFFFWQ